ncbi:hypothetical protein JAAARDRAFT_265172 [Jaapia argillacea MUCL 33604]|uniref:PH domain-containing protein n=1 Tax=Jaapia argillacea MUCL 33604 TaxID=933084 RepID=A0A067Q1V5_9AGAM|nr:hypothetical protein JAAARDRAFT_265172 [Jaapia argillacea MUCL 33604]
MLYSRDDVSSIYSFNTQPMTRCTTVTDYTDLPTPVDEIPAPYPTKRVVSGPRGMSTTAHAQLRSGPTSFRDFQRVQSQNHNLGAIPEAKGESASPGQPRGFDFSPGLDTELARSSTRRSRGSAKDLIKRYESLHSDSPKRPRRPSIIPHPTMQPPPGFPASAIKKHSPLRQSFRNLLSVFGRKSGTKSKDKDEAIRYFAPPQEEPPAILVADWANGGTNETRSHVEPDPFRTGPILYLSYPSTPTSPQPLRPVWTSCIASLFPTHLLLTSFTTQHNPHSQVIPFASCTDVRSVPLGQLDPSERDLLPGSTKQGTDDKIGHKVFEIFFDTGLKEKIAVSNVRDRAGWVSAIWDVLLRLQEHKPRDSVIDMRIADAEVDSTPSRSGFLSISSKAPTPNPSLAAYMDRSLPPTPALSASPAPSYRPPTDTTTPPRSSLYLPSTPSRARSKSPSIANLDQLSVVKQRLAQINRASSNVSKQSCKSAASRVGSIYSRSSADKKGEEQEESIIDSYIDQVPGSPLSVYTQQTAATTPLRNSFAVVEDSSLQVIEHLKEHSNQLADVGDRVANLYSDIHIISADLKDAIVANSTTNHNTPDLQPTIISKLENLSSMIQDQSRASKEGLQTSSEHVSSVVAKIDAVAETLKQLESAGQREVVVQNLAPSETKDDQSPMHAKLDELLHLCQQSANKEQVDTLAEPTTQALESPELEQVIALLKDNENYRTLQLEQQADSVRYLNELNTWLETFVNHGVSQMQSTVESVEGLRQDLGLHPGIRDENACAPTETIVGHISRLVDESRERVDDTRTLQASVHGLIVAVNEHLRMNAESRNSLNTESIVALIERQRQEQERMLRGLAAELSNEIRGERLRFVDAMQEATAINVQVHVEQFKKELTREVVSMTQEVSRMQREKQVLEQQIGDLFAFYCKQKQCLRSSPQHNPNKDPNLPNEMLSDLP